jgi:hypothetical protein
MRSLLTLGAGLLLGLALTTPLRAQSGQVHKMEIYNGGSITVRYFGVGVSPVDRSSLRELEIAENETGFVQDVMALKRQYVRDEHSLEAQRTRLLRDLYSSAMIQNSPTLYGPITTGFATFPSGNLFSVPYGALTGWGGYFGAPLTGLYGGYGAYNVLGLAGSGLAGGYGPGGGVGSGAIKDAMAGTIANQATAEYAMTVDKLRDRALVRAGSSPTLRVALRLPDRDKTPSAYRMAAAEDTAAVVVTLKGGDRVLGTKMQETKDWFIITTLEGKKVRVRPAEVIRVDEGKGGVRGAAD